MIALSHCLECAEWVEGPCAYVRCPFRIANPLQRGLDPSQGGGQSMPAFTHAVRPLHSAIDTPGGQDNHA
jgi:hypothetical protein